jgi:hypothetical protein
MCRLRLLAAGCCLVWLSMGVAAHAQNVGRGSTVESDALRGQGAYLQGAGWYNLRSAEAYSANVDAAIRWKQDLRKIQQERRELEARKKYGKIKNVDELKQQMARREQELRSNPSSNDVQSGAALNVLVYDLTDADLNSNRWAAVESVALPPGTSVKELIFSFTPHSVSTRSSAALSRGVIALSRLDIKDNWPVILKKDELTKERKAYEDAYTRVKDKVLKGDYAADGILALDTALGDLKKKISMEIPSERGFRSEATKFVDDLRDATRMFDANSVDYAREILIDTNEHDATTVQELVEFMSKYRLQFANSDRSPTARVLYGPIYEKLRQQADAFNLKPAVTATSVKDSSKESAVASRKPASISGRWKIDGNDLLQTNQEQAEWIFFGDPSWSNYDLNFKAMRIAGTSGFAAIFHKSERLDDNHCTFILGGWQNTRHAIGFSESGKHVEHTGRSKNGQIENGRWYDIRLEVRGTNYRAFLNSQEQFRDQNAKFERGMIGLRTNFSACRFRDLEVTAPDGKVLWTGFPTLPSLVSDK